MTRFPKPRTQIPAARPSGRVLLVRGFTLIEMMVVTTVLAMLAAVALPSLLALQRAQESRRSLSDLLSMARLSAGQARQTGRTFELVIDENNATVIVRPEAVDDERFPALPPTTANGLASTGIQEAANTPENDEQATVTRSLAASIKIQSATVDDESLTGETIVKFYSDGSAQRAIIQLSESDVDRTLVIDRQGGIQLTRGQSDLAQDRWPAGDLEQRQGAQNP